MSEWISVDKLPPGQNWYFCWYYALDKRKITDICWWDGYWNFSKDDSCQYDVEGWMPIKLPEAPK